MKSSQPTPVTMLMVTPDQLGTIVEEAVARATSGRLEDEVLTLREAAKFRRVDVKTIRRHVASGKIRALPGTPIRILRSELVRV